MIVNTMRVISARVPDELEAGFEQYLEAEQLARSTALRKLLSEQRDQWRRDRALDKLSEGTTTLSSGAELADCSVWEFAQLAADRDITWVDESHLDDDLAAL